MPGPPPPIRKIRGHLYKICRGPTHAKPVWLPLEDAFFRRWKDRRDETRHSLCRYCIAYYRRGNRAKQPRYRFKDHVSFPKYRWVFAELHKQIGYKDMALALQVSPSMVYNYIGCKVPRRVHRDIVLRAISRLLQERLAKRSLTRAA